MAETDRLKWDARYRDGAHPETEPDPFVVARLADAPPAGRALDVACGRGRHARLLAGRGYAVDAVDISAEALASARAQGGRGIRWIEQDLDGFAPESGAYALVVNVHYTDADLTPRLPDALGPGGVLVFVARPHALCHWGPRPGETARWFAALETLAHAETDDRIEYAGRRR